MSSSSVKRHLTLRIGDEEISVVAYREGDTIVVERDDEKFSVQLISESFVIPVAEGSAAPAMNSVSRAAAPPSSRPAAPAKRVGQAKPAAARPAPGPVGAGAIVSPMVGVVKEILVSAGDSVAAGDRVVVLEAMKMDIDVLAHDPGTVAEVNVAAGDNVTEGQQLVRVDAGSGA